MDVNHVVFAALKKCFNLGTFPHGESNSCNGSTNRYRNWSTTRHKLVVTNRVKWL